ncbi:MAG: hypothetical protein ACKOX2_17890, partial [Microcystaceae cyanobacterium]
GGNTLTTNNHSKNRDKQTAHTRNDSATATPQHKRQKRKSNKNNTELAALLMRNRPDSPWSWFGTFFKLESLSGKELAVPHR